MAQENYLVSTLDGLLSLYDLSSNTLITTARTDTGLGAVLPGPNNRLAFALNGDYLSVIDTTIQREITRLTDVNGGTAAIAPDGKLLLVQGNDGWLRFVDTATLKTVRKVSVSSILGPGSPGAVVIAANKVYLFPFFGSLTNVAVVDLTTYSVSSIALPQGYFNQANLASVTPDGKTVVALESEFEDSRNHVILISTITDSIVADYPQPTDLYFPYALVVTPNGSDPSNIFGYLAVTSNYGDEVVALDLRAKSPSYGQILSNTAVPLQLEPYGLAVNSDGTRLIAAGQPYSPSTANVYVIDALKMITDPSQAVVAQVTVDNGASTYVVATGFFSTTPPDTAPVITSVSGDVTNDADHDIQITGGNFQPGALVRIGTMPPLPANVTGSTLLSVTVPANAPSGKALDIVVTNPETQGPPDQQNQSGLLPGQFNIFLNPKFQPSTQLATINDDLSISVLDLNQRRMVNVNTGLAGVTPFWPAFNLDGKELYASGYTTQSVLLPIDLSTDLLASPVPVPGTHQTSSSAVSASVDPTTGKPVVNVLWRQSSDLHIGVVDSDPNSPNFNTFVRIFDAGLQISSVFPFGIVSTSDGKFAYLWYRTSSPFYRYFLGIMNLSNGVFTQLSATSLGINQQNANNGIRPVLAPDGKTLLLSSFYENRWHIEIFDISNRTTPKRIAELTPVAIPGYSFPVVTSYQVVGNQLYAFDPRGVIVIFNFNRSAGDFRERGWYIYPAINTHLNSATQFAPNFAFSADGQWLYVADPVNDLIAVLDPTKLISGKDVVFTTIRAPYYPYRLAVSPVPPPSRALVPPALAQKERKN